MVETLLDWQQSGCLPFLQRRVLGVCGVHGRWLIAEQQPLQPAARDLVSAWRNAKTLIDDAAALYPQNHARTGQGVSPLREIKRDVPKGNNGSGLQSSGQILTDLRQKQSDVNSRAGSNPVALTPFP